MKMTAKFSERPGRASSLQNGRQPVHQKSLISTGVRVDAEAFEFEGRS